MTHNEKAIAAVRKEIQKTIDMIQGIEDEDDIRRFKGEWTRCKIYQAVIIRELSNNHEEWVDACKELRVLEGYDD